MTGLQSAPWGLPLADLEESLQRCESDLLALRDARMLITGGTGFLGSWLLNSLLLANSTLGLKVRLAVVTRQRAAVPIEDRSNLEFVETDICALPDLGAFDFVVHGAAGSSAGFGVGDGEPRAMAATIVNGSFAVIEAASRARAKVLFLSSGAVYGRQFAPVSEDDTSAPDPRDPRSAYGLAKRLAENLFCAATAANDLSAVIGRLFAFTGARLPLDVHYAAGNFLADALSRRVIDIQGDGTPRRSYLYAGDLAEWCWALLVRGAGGATYNVGSDEAVTIAELADATAGLVEPRLEVRIQQPPGDGPAWWYVPSIEHAAADLGLAPRVDLRAGLRKTFDWYASR